MKVNLLICASLLLFLSGSLPSQTQDVPADGQDAEPAQSAAPVHSVIEIENWTPPQRGWLYVLDPKPDASGASGRVWLVDPETAKVMGSVRTGTGTDFALSPDGARLFVASVTEGDMSELAVIDTAQGTILKSGAVVDRAIAGEIPPFSTMAVSGDGAVLRILIAAPKAPDEETFMLAAFDTKAGEFLRRVVRLGNCGPGRFISYQTADQFDFLCPRTNRIRLISVDGDSRQLRNLDIKLPWERRVGVGEAIETPGAQNIEIVRGDAGVFEMNLAEQQFAETAAHPGLANRVPPAAWPTSPDGSKLYLGYHKDYERSYDNRFYLDYGRPPNIRPENATASEIHVLDTHTWKKVGTIRPKMPFWSAAISKDGKLLYAMAPQKHSILVIDTVNMRQLRILKVGGAPALAVVAP